MFMRRCSIGKQKHLYQAILWESFRQLILSGPSANSLVWGLKRPYERDPDVKVNISAMLYQGNRQENPQGPSFSSFKEASPFGKGSNGMQRSMLNQGMFFPPYTHFGK